MELMTRHTLKEYREITRNDLATAAILSQKHQGASGGLMRDLRPIGNMSSLKHMPEEQVRERQEAFAKMLEEAKHAAASQYVLNDMPPPRKFMAVQINHAMPYVPYRAREQRAMLAAAYDYYDAFMTAREQKRQALLSSIKSRISK